MNGGPPPRDVVLGTSNRCCKGEDRNGHLETDGAFYFLVADGHGGFAAAEHVSKQLLPAIAAKAKAGKLEEGYRLEDALRTCFLQLHEEVRTHAITVGVLRLLVHFFACACIDLFMYVFVC